MYYSRAGVKNWYERLEYNRVTLRDGRRVWVKFGGDHSSAYDYDTHALVGRVQWDYRPGAKLYQWRMWAHEDWRRVGLMSELWEAAVLAGYKPLDNRAGYSISPYTGDGENFVNHWFGRDHA